MRTLSAGLSAACILICAGLPAQAVIPQSERDALIALYNSLGGTNWMNHTGWLGPPGSECTWYGVTCDQQQASVTRLDLPDNLMSGNIPGEIGDFPNLQALVLSGNWLQGSIPVELGKLTQLQTLSLSNPETYSYAAHLVGPIPAELGNLVNLEILELDGNSLSGLIPAELGNLTRLRILDLSSGFVYTGHGICVKGSLSDGIPSALGNLQNLQTLELSHNQLSGSIPSVLGNLANLLVLELSDDGLSGSVPPALENLRNLQTLKLSYNQLSGSIPAALGNLTNLLILESGYNQLSGTIPAELGNLTNLHSLGLGNNQLSGNIPAELGNMPDLQTLDLSGNQLSGSIPPELGSLSGLHTLWLGGNRLSGNIPAELGNLSHLKEISLDNNQLSGSISLAFGNLANLQLLILTANHLSGSIPLELGNLPNLQYLDLSQNQLSGAIPWSLGSLANLQTLGLSGNQLSGIIPSTLTVLTNAFLYIGYNALQAGIDPELKSFLNGRAAGWDQTQTVAPSSVSAVPQSDFSVLVTWSPIPFTDYAGRYEVWTGQISGGPYNLSGSTADKRASSLVLTGFTPGTTSYIVMRTVTEPNPYNQNAVTSDFSAEIPVSIPSVFQNLTLSDGGAAVSATYGSPGTAKVGYAAVAINSGSVPYGTAVFSYKQNGIITSEAAVPASPPSTSTRFFVDYRTRTTIPGSDGTVDIYTGFAAVNRGDRTAAITFALRDLDGRMITQGTGILEKDSHIAKYIHQLRDILSGFRLPDSFPTSTGYGTLEMSSDQPLSVVALRLTTNQRGETLLTSTPIADLTRPSASTPVYFPQLADGGGYTTSIILLNTSDAPESGRLNIHASDGSPLTISQVNGSSGASFNYSIPAGGASVIQTDASPQDVNVGWVELTPDAGTPIPAGAGIFQYSRSGTLLTESGIPSATATTHARVFVDTLAGHDTGLALGNPWNGSMDLSLAALQIDGSTRIGTGRMSLLGKGHSAAFADQLIDGLPAGFQGVLDIASNTPFAALTLRSLVNERGDFLLTTFPVADMNAPAPFPIIFPQIADGGGYKTEFILLSSAGPSNTMLSFYGETGMPLAIGK